MTSSGLTVAFSCLGDLEAALSKFCSSATDSMTKLDTRSSSFAILPSMGVYGLFSAFRVRIQHFTKFGDCRLISRPDFNTIWFSTKHAMLKALRDGFIQRTYPTLCIDSRNISIPKPLHQPPPASCPLVAPLLEQCCLTGEKIGLTQNEKEVLAQREQVTGSVVESLEAELGEQEEAMSMDAIPGAVLRLQITPRPTESLATLQEEVTEDFTWFDCPGLEVTLVEDRLEVVVADLHLGLVAVAGLKHKYHMIVVPEVYTIFLLPSTILLKFVSGGYLRQS